MPSNRMSRDEVAAAYDHAASYYDSVHDTWRERLQNYWIERDMIAAANRAQTVLEVGVGTGRVLGAITSPLRVGIDISQGMVDRAGARPGIVALVADATALPFPDASFEVVLAPKGVFRYLDWNAAFRQIRRVLRPRGSAWVHQYVTRTGRNDPRVREVDDIAHWKQSAIEAGFRTVSIKQWRTSGKPPFVIPAVGAIRATQLVTMLEA